MPQLLISLVLVLTMLGIEPGDLYTLERCSTTQLYPQPTPGPRLYDQKHKLSFLSLSLLLQSEANSTCHTGCSKEQTM